jgi:hypothetical protein
MIAQPVLVASATIAATMFVSGCGTNRGQARVSGQSLRCVREFGPAGKVPPVVVKCSH